MPSSHARVGSKKNADMGLYSIAIPQPETTIDEKQGGRQQQIVLFLDRQRPHVEQNLVLGGRREIVCLLPQNNIGEKYHCSHQLLQKVVPLDAIQQPGRQNQTDNKHRIGCRKQAQRTSRVKISKTERTSLYGTRDLCRDQIARDDEKDINAKVSTSDSRCLSVKKHDQQHGQAAKGLNINSKIMLHYRGYYL